MGSWVGSWNPYFCGHFFTEACWAITRLVVAIRVTPEIGASGENTLVIRFNLETRECVEF